MFENFESNEPLSVSAVTAQVKECLDRSFSNLYIEGEISNFRPSGAGHYYFSLKDQDAVLSAVMFKNRINALQFLPADGMKVRVRGSISVYAKRGAYQIICEKMDQAGEGDILAMLERRKRKLASEGLFDLERKKPIPKLPSRIAVITSPTGAAVRDILRITGRRCPGINIVVLPAIVQGEQAADDIASRVMQANSFELGDVLIVGRGGGSLEDLLPFSDEKVVRAIAGSKIPVISAVGHEIDTSLADLASDLAAPTPSAAAEIATPDKKALLEHIKGQNASIITSFRQKIERTRFISSRFTPDLMEKGVARLMQPIILGLDDAKEGLNQAILLRRQKTRYALNLAYQKLKGASPEVILARGYAMVKDTGTGKIITQTGQAAKDSLATIEFAKGRLYTRIEDIEHEKL